MLRVVPWLLLLGGMSGCAASGPIALAGTQGCGFVTAMRMAMAGLPCTPPQLPPAPYCTRSLADVDCWKDPQRLPDRPPQVAEGGWEAPELRAQALRPSTAGTGGHAGRNQAPEPTAAATVSP